jgi:hypothetical protein
VPRDLADVLHYFMPELTAEEDRPEAFASSPQQAGYTSTPTSTPTSPPTPSAHRSQSQARELQTSALPLAALPISDHEIVRASLISSLAVEIAALGGDVTILTPATPNAVNLFPTDLFSDRLFPDQISETTRTRVRMTQAEDLASLHRDAVELAEACQADKNQAGVVLVRIPPLWLRGADHASELLEWMLLFTSPDQRNLENTYALAAMVLKENPTAEIGITVHGAKDRRDAEMAFGRLARNVEQQLGSNLASYGLLVEDLDIYRALVGGTTVGRAYPGSLSAQTLRAAAKLVFERACKANFN